MVSGSRKLQISFGIKLAARELEWVRKRAAGRSLLSERVERIRLDERSSAIAQRSDGAYSVRMVIAGC